MGFSQKIATILPMKTVKTTWVLLAAIALLPLCARAAATNPPAAPSPKPADTNWTDMFDGKTLTGWKESDFTGKGSVKVKEGQLLLGTGVMTGVTWTNPVIKTNYEIELLAMRVEGSDFFCALTFPVGDDPCTLIVGGWGGGLVGLSSIDGEDASGNETTKYMEFENGKWYHIRLRFESGRIQVWIDATQVIKVDTKDHKFSIRFECDPSLPLGIATWSTTGAVKNIRIRKL
jgi:hypothetical protein